MRTISKDELTKILADHKEWRRSDGALGSRASAIVVCSCGARWGNAARAAACEDMEVAEHALLETYVAKMVRHWTLGHRLALGENAPREFLATIARAAARAADAEPGELPPADD